MALQKSPLTINFAQGLDTKTDPFQVSPGRFLQLQNTIFDKAGLMQKRNGFGQLTSLPDTTSTFITTFHGNLTAIGDSLSAYIQGPQSWVTKGDIQTLSLDVIAAYRSGINQSQADTVTAGNGLMCVAFTDNIPSGGTTTPLWKYTVIDSITAQNVIPPTTLASCTGSPRTFLLGNYFIIVYSANIAAVDQLKYIAINVTVPQNVLGPFTISSQYSPAPTVAFDGIVANNNLYLVWNGSDGGGAIRVSYIDSTLTQHITVAYPGFSGDYFTICADITGSSPVIFSSFYDSGTMNGFTLVTDHQLNPILAPTATIVGQVIDNLASAAENDLATLYYEVDNNYSYDAAIPTHYIEYITIDQAGTVSAPVILARSVGLASKAFILNGVQYLMAVYDSPNQPTYFLLDELGQVVSKLAYSNGGGYLMLGLPGVTIVDNEVSIAYLIKDLIQSVNKSQNAPAVNGVYSQTGINVATFTIGISDIVTAEIGQDLHITGGFLWMYDGDIPVEHSFHLWPDSVEVTTAGAGGAISAQQYFYQVTYEWNDAQGNVFRSAPSIPVSVTTVGATSANTINIPTLRLTYKIANPVKIVIYRWSTGQQTYYEVTSILAPLENNPSVDSVTFVDTLADSSIIGNTILYTTGGVIENIAAPASDIITLFQSRLFLVDAEDKNLLWFSKQVIEGTPVEMSDLLTIFVAPTLGAQGSTGDISAISAMDDKLIIFKENALYYINGIGPDNTGANNQFSEPIFISSTVGCTNEHSIVFTPQGLMFQSDKGIWLLGRGLSTEYIGAPVQEFTTGAIVKSAINVPGTNQVRFTLDTGITLMYDYYFNQWGAFVNIPAISSTLYQDLHTYLNQFGQVFQENPGSYLDGAKPVLMSFKTGWMNLAGLQGFERAYYFYLLGVYKSPHKLSIGIAYDYADNIAQQSIIMPDNFNGTYGSDPLYGSGSPYGGNGNIEQWRVFLQQQKCQAFQITLNEIYDATFGVKAGEGLTLSGLTLVVGAKKSYPTLKPSRSIG